MFVRRFALLIITEPFVVSALDLYYLDEDIFPRLNQVFHSHLQITLANHSKP